ncbi:MAG: YdcF family protein [Burkholderiales bacterium]
MLYLHKILPLLLMPLVVTGAMVAYGIARKRPRWAWAGLLLLYAGATPLVAGALFGLVECGMQRREADEMPAAQAIVVLSGMLGGVPGSRGVVVEWGDADRFFGGLELYRAGKASLLIFTGGRVPWQDRIPPEGQVLKAHAEAFGVRSADIRVSADAANTAEEAQAVRSLLGAGVRDILLVTSAFHMPRAQTLFTRAGFHVIAYPVDFKVGVAARTPMDFLPSAAALAMSEGALREMLGRAYYAVFSRP